MGADDRCICPALASVQLISFSEFHFCLLLLTQATRDGHLINHASDADPNHYCTVGLAFDASHGVVSQTCVQLPGRLRESYSTFEEQRKAGPGISHRIKRK